MRSLLRAFGQAALRCGASRGTRFKTFRSAGARSSVAGAEGDAGCAAGVMRLPDSRVAAMALISMLTGVTHWYREGGRYDRAGIEAIYQTLVRNAVGAG